MDGEVVLRSLWIWVRFEFEGQMWCGVQFDTAPSSGAVIEVTYAPLIEQDIGEFIVTEVTKGINQYTVTALDKMILLDGEADLSGVTYTTAQAFLEDVFEELGFTLDIQDNIDTSISICDPAFEVGATYRQVLSKICESLGAGSYMVGTTIHICWYDSYPFTTETFTGDGSNTVFWLDGADYEVEPTVYMDGEVVPRSLWEWELVRELDDSRTYCIVEFNTAPDDGAEIVITWANYPDLTVDESEYTELSLTEKSFTVTVEVTTDPSAIACEMTDSDIVVRIVNNPFLANYTEAQRTAYQEALQTRVGGFPHYGGNVTTLPMPELYPYDGMVVKKGTGRYYFPITSTTYGINENTKFEAKISGKDNGYNFGISREIDTLQASVEDMESNSKHFFYRDDSGVHMTMVENEPNTGRNTLINADGMYVRDGRVNLAFFGDTTIIGNENEGNVQLSNNEMDIYITRTKKAFSITSGIGDTEVSTTTFPEEYTVGDDTDITIPQTGDWVSLFTLEGTPTTGTDIAIALQGTATFRIANLPSAGGEGAGQPQVTEYTYTITDGVFPITLTEGATQYIWEGTIEEDGSPVLDIRYDGKFSTHLQIKSYATSLSNLAMIVRTSSFDLIPQMAFGEGAEANGNHSVAIGEGVVVNGDNQVVVGQYNLSSNNTSNFAVGTGYAGAGVNTYWTGFEVGHFSDSDGGGMQAVIRGYPARLTLQNGGFNGITARNSYISAYYGGGGIGNNMLVQAGGNLVIGGGEYPTNKYDDGLETPSGEDTYIGADGDVWIEPNANTIANVKRWLFSSDGSIYEYHSGAGVNMTGSNGIRQILNMNGDTLRIGYGQYQADYSTTIQGGTVYINTNRQEGYTWTLTNAGNTLVPGKISFRTNNKALEMLSSDGSTYYDCMRLNGSDGLIIGYGLWNSSVGTTYLEGNNLSLNAKVSPITANQRIQAPVGLRSGSTASTTIADKSISSGTSWVNLGSFSLPAGVWRLTVVTSFASNGTGIRGMCVSSTSGGGRINAMAEDTCSAVSGFRSNLSVDIILNPSASTTYYVNAFQSSGSALSVTTRWNAEYLGSSISSI